MKIEQTQKIEEIVETLERLQEYINKETAHLILFSKREYINDMFKNVDDMIDDLTNNDAPDIMDMGLNELSIGED